ncbi:nitroreductase family protein [Methylomonas sp. DH-1]|uniref:nitroreductase family protein n=1 Tax=Methylomonas sp. (strain DH-1) TaxID=1727196 RepID=UPI0007C94C75|nr:nitroreductase family protein [Methylomonas sp. DH-1]ANE56291.1 hypothetical protein AYM39_14615 [Methylomonas sp. DH-1]
MEKTKIETILDAAIRAPSGDNSQPWRFDVTDDYSRIVLYNLPEKDDSYYNYQQVASYIAHGAVIENISVASRHLGLSINVSLFPNSSNFHQVAAIDFRSEESFPVLDPLYESIFKRSTNRFRYQSSKSTIYDLNLLVESVKEIPNVVSHFVTDPSIIDKLARAFMINDSLVFENKAIHSFLFRQIRWNREQSMNAGDGMTLDVLGLSWPEKLLFPILRFWRFVKLANYLGLSRVVGLKCWYNFRNVPVIGMLCVEKTDRVGFIQAGRAMQRVWLEATRQGLDFQPLVGLPLLFYRGKTADLSAFPEKRQKQLFQAEAKLRELLNVGSSEELVIGFRIGKTLRVGGKTLRKPVSIHSY